MGNCMNSVQKQVDTSTIKNVDSQSQSKHHKTGSHSNSLTTTSTNGNVVAPQDIWTRLQSSPQIGDWLKNVPIFCRVPEDKRNKVGGVMETRVFKNGEPVFEQGDVGDRFYVIKKGVAAVTIHITVEISNSSEDVDASKIIETTEKEVARLKTGDYFGETALLSKAKRNATIRAVEGELETLTLDSKTFKKLFRGLNVQLAKRKGVTELNAGSAGDAETDDNEEKVTAKTDAEISEIVAIFESSDSALFQRLNHDQKTQIAETMWKKEYEPNQEIGSKGEILSNLYLVKSGVAIKGENDELGEGCLIGELGLMYNSPLQCTFKNGAQHSEFWVINRKRYRKIVKNSSIEKLAEFETFIQTVPILGSLLQFERKRIAETLEEIHFKTQHEIVKQGDLGDTFYIVRKGTAVVTKDDKEVLRIGAGDFFGERALIKNDVRAATVTVTSEDGMECLMLDREGFTLLLGPLGEIMERKIAAEYDGDCISISVDGLNPESVDLASMASTKKQLNIELSELVMIGTLGKGSFGHVELCCTGDDPDDDEHYALKTVHKSHVVQLGQQEHIINEKRVLIALTECSFIIKLFATFKDAESVYFLLEPVLGGELFALLRDRSAFDEQTSAFYAACVVEAFGHMHSKHIIYRDLKPENLLLSSNGYLKITDFGFAKFVTDRTWTLCGTPDYLAPEVVSGIGHNQAVDWWTLGILIYEMISSYPPFYDDDPMQTYTKIMHGNIDYPRHFSKNVIDLIKRLLQPKPTKRLGIIKGGVENIKNHAWFRKTTKFDWEKFEALQMSAPYKPEISGPKDLSNFQEYSDDTIGEVQTGLIMDDGDDWDREF